MGDQPGEIASGAAARASAHQREAADPAVSAFVAASAGSGKTKLLTDRLLRLMLGGADPGRILCLTFTKAAAAEMALRLQARLGRWVGLQDAALDAELRALAMPANAATRATARRLFAAVLDLPGGMRISTIHAFCQSLLRRFPLEAGISPHFRLIEDQDEAEALDEAIEARLAGAADPADAAALALLAGFTNAAQFRALVQALLAARSALTALSGHALAGLAAGPEDAQGMAAFLRGELVQLWGREAADEVRILYGGSVTPDNIETFLAESDVDGALVGGASLDAGKFGRMYRRK
jgi:ATP-dependent helicase/nuclease subunit A